MEDIYAQKLTLKLFRTDSISNSQGIAENRIIDEDDIWVREQSKIKKESFIIDVEES